MSDRAAETGHEGATVCPFVAFQDDRERRATDPDHRHRCYAELLPAPRAIAHQRRYCLSPEFPSCPIFQDWAIRAAATGVSMPSARSVTGPPPPIAPHAGGVNGSGKRTPDWAAPPPWVDAAGEPPGVPTAPSRGQLTAFDDQRLDGEGGGDGEGDGEAPMSEVVAARDRTGAKRQTTRASGGTGAGGTTDNERARSGRGFAYDLIADDPAFAAPPDGDEGDEGEIDDEA
ncbi:MAG: hypothetical protein H0W07_02905, partial [Chloroflexi bacterium]|nr:hypothetical protein [Chloroflexota bacterium]